MKITLDGEPNEIAALVLAVQERHETENPNDIVGLSERLANAVNTLLKQQATPGNAFPVWKELI